MRSSNGTSTLVRSMGSNFLTFLTGAEAPDGFFERVLVESFAEDFCSTLGLSGFSDDAAFTGFTTGFATGFSGLEIFFTAIFFDEPAWLFGLPAGLWVGLRASFF